MARKLTADQSHCGQFESEIRAAQQANSGTKAVNSQIVCQRKSCIRKQLSKISSAVPVPLPTCFPPVIVQIFF